MSGGFSSPEDGYESGGASAPDELMVDVIGGDGRTVWVNEEEARAIGFPVRDLINLPIESIYTVQSVDVIHSLLRRTPSSEFARTVELDLVGRGGQVLHTLARCRSIDSHLRIAKMDFSGVRAGYERLATDNALLRNIVDDAAEAHWCIEFIEPVDVAQPRAEIVRQIFENQSIWRMCNRAMADLHGLPRDVDFNSQSVRLYWPRNPENEAFAERIIDANYAIDRAISIDLSHDGTPMFIENDVRAEVSDGYLRRLWGNCRDVSDRRRDGHDNGMPDALAQSLLDRLAEPTAVLMDSNGVAYSNRRFTNLLPDRATWEDLANQPRVTIKRRNFEIHVQPFPAPNGAMWKTLVLKRRPDSAKQLRSSRRSKT